MAIFKDYFNSIADTLQCNFEGTKGINHPGDKGELCEIFVKNFLERTLSDVYRIVRGGIIVNIDGKKSKQLDIILTGRNTINIFEEKGLYPVESVFGVFSITAKLDRKKLFSSCLEEFKTIPKENLRLHPGILDKEKVLSEWQKNVPIKCIFAYDGSLNEKWETELNEAVRTKPEEKNFFPDFIIINKKGMITKIIKKPTRSSDGALINKDFHYTRFGKHPRGYSFYGAALEHILVKLYNLSCWQFFITPEYHEYFNMDML